MSTPAEGSAPGPSPGPPPPPWPPAPAPPGGSWSAPPDAYGAAPPRTEPFAVVSLVCSIAAVSFCFVGSIAGIVFGHIARSRIKRSGDRGSGLALAGLIVGYVGLAFVVLGIAAFVAIFAVLVANGDADAAADARRLDRELVVAARLRATTPRDAAVVRRVLSGSEWDAGFETVTVGTTGLNAAYANERELRAEGWQLEVAGDFGDACLTIPAEPVARASDVTEGPCP